MKKGQALPKDTLQATDLDRGKVYPIVIGRHGATREDKPDSCAMRELRQEDGTKKAKPLMAMEGRKKYLVLNATNFDKLIELTGEEDSCNWIGKRVVLYRTTAKAFGKTVPAIRIDREGAKAPPADVEHHADDDEAPFTASDEDVPF